MGEDNKKMFSSQIEFKKNMVIFSEGEPGDFAYIILKGSVGIYKNGFCDLPTKIAVVEMGNIIGEMSLLDNAPRSATVITEQDSILASIKKEDINEILTNNSDFAFKLLKTLSKRIRFQNEKIIELEKIPETGLFTNDSLESDINDAESFIKTISDIKMPNEYLKYIYDKKICCPVCNKKFTQKAPIFSTLYITDLEKDMRIKYKDFDINWFSIISCPSCTYSNLYSMFDTITKDNAKKIREELPTKRNISFVGFKEPISFDQVFYSYYMALICNNIIGGNAINMGKLWLRLYWLYDDLKLENMRNMAAEKVINYFNKVVENNFMYLPIRDKQYILAVLGALHIAIGNKEESMKMYFKIIEIGQIEDHYIYKIAQKAVNEQNIK